ncbi:hypothetical protein OS493_020522 [Desmophyllum pertusum]|uniref:EF-hand domain-containing protein n=1 Tax=Desmophyllum pertusum TaxID=174260 RepID=A0A9W9Z1S3_9CNID|nr:hypothetical protein OS493_020522 [Desmophyllum pertusum]
MSCTHGTRRFREKCPKGKMSEKKFSEIYMNHYSTGDASVFAGHVFRTFDKNNDGTIDFHEFIQGLSIIYREDRKSRNFAGRSRCTIQTEAVPSVDAKCWRSCGGFSSSWRSGKSSKR